MRNSKVKGFTLIELIVVIAIIGILAAILGPSMLGYVRNARISQANANAKQVHTACSSALTQLGIANKNLKKSGEAATINATNYIIYVPAATTGANGPIINATWESTPTDSVSAEQLDLVSYLGENFKGHGMAYFNPTTYSVSCALYAAGTGVAGNDVKTNAILGAAKTKMGNDNGTLTNSIGEVTQKTDAKNGSLYGVYPQGSGS